MWSLWTQLENSTRPSVPLVAMLLVPNVESKADLLCPCRNLDLSLCFGISFAILKSASDRSSSSLRMYNIYINIYNIYISRSRHQNSSLLQQQELLALYELEQFRVAVPLYTAGQTGQHKPIPSVKPFQLEAWHSPSECRISRVYSRSKFEC